MNRYNNLIEGCLKVKLTSKQKEIMDFFIEMDKRHSEEYDCSFGSEFTVGQQQIADKLGVKRCTVTEHLSKLKSFGVLTQTDNGNSFQHINSSYVINYKILYGDKYEEILNRNKEDKTELTKNNETNEIKINNNMMYNNNLEYDFDSKKYVYECSDKVWVEHNMSDVALATVNNIISQKSRSMTDSAILGDISNYSSFAAYWYGDAMGQGQIHNFDEFAKMLNVKKFGNVNLYEAYHRGLHFIRTALYIKYTPSQFYCLMEKIKSIGLLDNSNICMFIRKNAVQDTYNYVYDSKCIDDLYKYILTVSCSKLYDVELKVFPNRGLLDVKEILGI